MKRMIKRVLVAVKNRGKRVYLCSGCSVTLNSCFEGHNYIGKNTGFCGTMGYGSYIAQNSSIYGTVGRYTSIASNVSVVVGTHPVSRFISTHPAFYSLNSCVKLCFCNENKYEEYKYADAGTKSAVVIGNDVWIGYGATLLAGVTIGDGAIIAAGAVVTKDVPPYTIVGGVPAKEIRRRFPDEIIEELIKLQWWNQPEEWLRNNAALFEDAQMLCKAAENVKP